MILLASPVSAQAHGDSLLEPGQPTGAVDPYCRTRVGQPCRSLSPDGANVYEVSPVDLRRLEAGSEVYRISLAVRGAVARLVAASPDARILAVVLDIERVSSRSMIMGGAGEMQRQYSCTIRNPKSGEEIKSIALGMFRPEGLAVAEGGALLLMAGKDLQTGRALVRAYDIRSGALLDQRVTKSDGKDLVLASDGFVDGSQAFRIRPQAVVSGARHRSSNPYSVAEFTLKSVEPLSRAALADAPLAVLAFAADRPEIQAILSGAAQSKLRGAGLVLIERARIAELLEEARFQNLGITDDRTAAELGKLANARGVVFGSLAVLGETASLSMRLVDVDSGVVRATIELECRDCREDDYLEALDWAVRDWVRP